MITITNTGPSKPSQRSNILGERNYEVRYTTETPGRELEIGVIATFTHTRANGLAACLLAASKAVALQERGAAKAMAKAREALRR